MLFQDSEGLSEFIVQLSGNFPSFLLLCGQKLQ